MNKMSVFFVMLFALCIVLPASAQVDIGVMGGLNLANLSANPDQNGIFSTGLTYGLGGVLDYGLGKHIALHLEPMYLQKGSETKEEGAPDFRQFKFRLAYLEVPIMLKYAFGTTGTKPYVMAGPTIGFNLSSKVTAREVSALRSISYQELDVKTRDFDFGLGFGAGVSVPRSKYAIFLEARYALGLTNILDGPGEPYADVKTRGFQVFTGITFPLGNE